MIFSCLAVTLAVPVPEDILSYDAADHKHSQTGEAGNSVKGSYSYTDAEGKTYTINYEADENGYRATGDHLPVAPEVPAVPEVSAPVAADVPVAPEVKVADPAPVVVQTVPVYPGATFPIAYNRLAYSVPFGYSYGHGFGAPYGFPYYSYY